MADQDSEIGQLLDDIDDLKNLSLCKTLIFKSIPYNSNNENSWNEKCPGCRNSRSLYQTSLVKLLSTLLKEPIKSPSNYLNYKKKGNHLAKTKSWDTEELKPASIKANQSDASRVFVSQIYSKALTIRRNEVLKL